MTTAGKVAVCESRSRVMFDILSELGYKCTRTGPDAVSITSAILNSGVSAFAADCSTVPSAELHKVFGFMRSIDFRSVRCIVITSDPDEFSGYNFVRCCRRGLEFEALVRTCLGIPSDVGKAYSYDNSGSFAKARDEEENLERTVTEIIQKMGVPPNVKGYRYLRNAVMIATEDMSVLDSVTKRLYPIVAINNKTTPTRVERAIRHAITAAWERQNGDKEFIEDKLRCHICFDGGKPTNSELIALISDSLRVNAR